MGILCAKLDTHEAYDTVEWNFLETMMIRLGFHEQFIALLMSCVKFVKYKIRFIDHETFSFIPGREIPYHHICSCFVHRNFRVYWLIERRFVAWKVSGFAEMLHQSHIFSLLRIP
jgi:hypothetical protein